MVGTLQWKLPLTSSDASRTNCIAVLTTFLWDPTFRALHQTGTVAVVMANDKSSELQRLQDYRDYGLGLKAVPWVLRTRVPTGLSRGPNRVPGCHVARWSMAHGRTHDGFITAHSIHDPTSDGRVSTHNVPRFKTCVRVSGAHGKP